MVHCRSASLLVLALCSGSWFRSTCMICRFPPPPSPPPPPAPPLGTSPHVGGCSSSCSVHGVDGPRRLLSVLGWFSSSSAVFGYLQLLLQPTKPDKERGTAVRMRHALLTEMKGNHVFVS